LWWYSFILIVSRDICHGTCVKWGES